MMIPELVAKRDVTRYDLRPGAGFYRIDREKRAGEKSKMFKWESFGGSKIDQNETRASATAFLKSAPAAPTIHTDARHKHPAHGPPYAIC